MDHSKFDGILIESLLQAMEMEMDLKSESSLILFDSNIRLFLSKTIDYICFFCQVRKSFAPVYSSISYSGTWVFIKIFCAFNNKKNLDSVCLQNSML